jgi:DNA repair protein RecN (Recombination protein N)
LLVELHIRDFALIDELTIELDAGFSVLTGETGAGKSIIVDALGTVLGERTGADMIRTGAQKCIVEAVFDVSDAPLARQIAADFGFDIEENALIVSREISRNGRSQARINGRPATAAALKDVTSHLVDVHGQHEHQSLLQVPIHVDILDNWIGAKALQQRAKAAELHTELAAVIRERDQLRTNERERARLVDLYNFQLTEIESARLSEGEEEALSAEQSRLSNAERLYASASELYDSLATSEAAVIDRLSEATGIAGKIADLDPSMEGLSETLNTALASAQDGAATLRDYVDSLDADPGRLEQVNDRLELIKNLKRKYGDEVGDIIKYAAEIADKLNNLTNAEQRSSELSGRIAELEARLTETCGELSRIRTSACREFETRIESELKDLSMEKTRFEVSIRPAEIGPTGGDSVEFLISPNPGEPVKPLVRIASGGEISRIMLALKTVAARSQVPTMIFDEIDSGIGGRTANVLGDKLACLADCCQVMCVTHLPQVAGKARAHFGISKIVQNDRTKVSLTPLCAEERVAELARMLGGDISSDAATQHARELLSVANSRNN